jgi:murein DD-endopeptidase MepM/ murein hydrolase activator NlpD
MSTRNAFPKPRLPSSHYFVTLARGDEAKCFAIRPWALWTIGAIFPIGALIYLASTLLLVMRDDMLAALMHRQSAMQVAYEDRLANMRMQLDRVTSSQLLDQNSLEARMHDLLSRQARLESRSAVVATLADTVGVTTAARGPAAPAGPATAQQAINANPLLGKAPAPALPANALGFAPSGGPMVSHPGLNNVPRPGPVEIQSSDKPAQKPQGARGASLLDARAAQLAADTSLPPEIRIGALVQSLDRIESEQIRTVSVIAGHAQQTERELRQAIAATGLPADKLQAPPGGAAMGGPFVPFKLDANGSPFEREVLRMQGYVANADKLRRVAGRLPLRKPLAGDPEITSGFGSRVDPFNGRLAAHTGIDFRQAWGSPVRATAAGTVVSAGPNGGYGNMVDIDHGNGVVSRYAHLSAVLVKSGQTVNTGTVLGRLGSTGRSTGPHLHYEVRYNDQPLDPRRFLAAGQKLAQK